MTNDCEKVLNKDIDSKELLNIVKRLKSKKAVALDLISNDMIKFSTSTFKNALIKLFNLILKSNHIPKGWSQGLLTPVHKKGNNKTNDLGVELPTCFLVSDIWFSLDGSSDPCCSYTFSHSYTFFLIDC